MPTTNPVLPEWFGVLLVGIVTSILATLVWELRARIRSYREAGVLVGEWEAFDIKERKLVKMVGAGIGVVEHFGKWWSAQSNVLKMDARGIPLILGTIKAIFNWIGISRAAQCEHCGTCQKSRTTWSFMFKKLSCRMLIRF